ncbi:MAG: hypothetical protein ACE5IC_00040 [Candidatus Brocadiales bacterium]
MTKLPVWLPATVSVNPWTQDTFDTLYSIFARDFKNTQPIYEGYIVWFFPEMEDGKEVVFWHLTHRDDKNTGERLPDLRRSERLPWARKMLDNPDKPEILAWDYKEGDGSIKTYVWLKDYDYLVLMKKYPNESRRLITSYYIDFPHKRRKLERKYTRRMS